MSKEKQKVTGKFEKGNHYSPSTEFKKGFKSWLGKKMSKEARNNMSLAKIGKPSGRLGIKHTPESIQKMKESHKGYIPKSAYKIIGWNKGKNHSEEHKKRISLARSKQVLPSKDTSIEVKIQNYLKQLGYEFLTHQYLKELNHPYQCDILIPSINLVIECDGDYWHNYPIGKDLDHIHTKNLIEKGFKVLRLWECEINKISIEEFKLKMENIV